VLAVVLLREQMTPIQFVGGLLVLASVVLLQVRGTRKRD
jgi:drug/metabolite transporter (DMT)-like permease